MNRRSFVRGAVAASAVGAGVVAIGVPAALARAAVPLPGVAGMPADPGRPHSAVPAPTYHRLLILVELKGGNDAFNAVVPYADPAYYALRPKLAIPREAVVQLTDRIGLHPALAPLAPLFREGRLALLQGVGYPAPNLSHFRSIEIWDTATASDRYATDGWLTRTFAAAPAPGDFATNGVVIGATDMGPLSGSGTRAIALANAEQFRRRAQLARAEPASRNRALAHILATENDIVAAATRLDAPRALATNFPGSAFGNAVRTACELAANTRGIACLHLTLNGFDTHAAQAPTQARLLTELAAGLMALQQGLREVGRWDDALVLTYAEFGRRPRENLSGGTDHGTASTHLAMGGRVAGGLLGAAPDLARLDGTGNVAHAIDFRSVYATILDRWWNVAPSDVLGGRFERLPLVRS